MWVFVDLRERVDYFRASADYSRESEGEREVEQEAQQQVEVSWCSCN